MVVRGQSFTGIFTCLAARSETGHCTVNARPLLANATDADAGTLISGLHSACVPFRRAEMAPPPPRQTFSQLADAVSRKTGFPQDVPRDRTAHRCTPPSLLHLISGKPAKVNFRFKVGRKLVSGWAGVLEKGSRRDAGFSIIQSDRVITGWPDSYRPETIFGEQEGGSNNLVNQRLFGELILEGFEVSHTKDQILFDDGEQEELELNLKKQLGGMRQLALSYRKGADDIQVLMSVGKLTPLGDPAPNAPKWFAAVEIIRLVADQDWLHKATKEISKYWKSKRERHSNHLATSRTVIVECE